MTKIFAISNLKGGVGKSTTSVMLAEGLAYFLGLKVLIVDLDSQASTSQMLLTEAGVNNSYEARHGVPFILKSFQSEYHPPTGGMLNPNATVIEELHNKLEHGEETGWVSLLPSHPSLRRIELELEEKWYSGDGTPASLMMELTSFLSRSLEEVSNDFHVILLDCPPSLSPVARCGLNLADYFIVPTLADVVSFWGLKQFSSYCKEYIENYSNKQRYIVVTRWNETNHAQDMYQRLITNLGGSTLGPQIQQTVRIQEAMERPNRNSRLTFRRKYQGNAFAIVELLAQNFARFMEKKEGTQWAIKT